MQLKAVTPVGNGNHLRLTLQRDEFTITAMLFFTTAEQFPYITGELLDLAVTLDVNEYNNKESLSIIIKDIKSSNADTEVILRQGELFDRFMSLERLTKEEAEILLPTRDDFATVFKFLRSEKQWNYPDYIICTRLNNSRINYGRLQVILNAMHQLSLIDYKQNRGNTSISILPTKGKADLNTANIMKLLQNYII